MFYAVTLVLLFLLRIRFPRNQAISQILSSRYGVPTLKVFRNLERTWKQHGKAKLDLEFLETCHGYDTLPKFLRIRLYKRPLENTPLCKTFQRKLLLNEIRFKRKNLTLKHAKLEEARAALKESVSALDYSCITLWLERKQESNNKHTQRTHERKLHKLGITGTADVLDADKVIFNFSNKVLLKEHKRTLCLGLNFSIPVHKLRYFKYYLIYEKLIKSFDQMDIYSCVNDARKFFRSQLQSIAHKYFYNFKSHKNICPLFTKKHLSHIKDIANDKSLYISKPDKGNGVVILNRVDYITKVNDILCDRTKFEVVQSTNEQKLVIKLEDKVNNVLRNFKKDGSISDSFYDNCFTSGSNLGVLYGLPKVHKENCPVRPILSAYSMHNFNLGKALVPLLSHLASSQHTLRNSTEFAMDLRNIRDANNFYMCSLDVESLYTSIPVAEAINIVLDFLYTDNDLYHNLTRVQFKKLLELALNDTYFKFNGKIYKQLNGLAMGSALSPVIANIFLNSFEAKYLTECPIEFRPFYYKRYLDDTFILFKDFTQATNFYKYFNSRHTEINFTFEGEIENKIPFLDITIEKANNAFTTTIFRKKTFTGSGLNYFSDILMSYKISSIITLINRAFTLTSSYAMFHEEIVFLRKYFTLNAYPVKLFNTTLHKYLNNKFTKVTNARHDVPRKNAYLELPYIGRQSKQMMHEVKQLVAKFFPQINAKFYSRNNNKISSVFRRDLVETDVLMGSNIVYKYNCDCCQQSYIGSTMLQMFVRVHKHKGTSFRTNRPLAKPELSAIRSHCNSHDHPFKSTNFSVIDKCNTSDLRTLESLHIHKSRPDLNNYQTAEKLQIVI